MGRKKSFQKEFFFIFYRKHEMPAILETIVTDFLI